METIADEEYLKDKRDTPFILVMEHTPKVILDSMDGSNDRKILIRRDALYLAIREDGIQEGHYHGLGKEVLSKLPEYLEQPDVVLSTIDPETKAENKSRRLVLTHIPTKNGQAIVSIEFESLKDFEGKNDYFNMIITVFDLHENYLKRQFKKFGAKVKYIKEDLAQVNPQLFEWLRTINARSSTDSISHPSDSVNTVDKFSLSERTDNAIDNRTLLANAFESVAQNDVERSWLLKYKLQIVKLNEDQNKLAELRAKIDRIRYTKGQDRSKLPALSNKAAILADRINRADTIVDESAGTGAKLWGKLSDGGGWVTLDYCVKM